MDKPLLDPASYWSTPLIEVNLLVFAHLLGALLLGLLVGVGFYGAAILLSTLSAGLMMWGTRLEAKLPSRRAMGVTLGFMRGSEPDERQLKNTLTSWGYMVAEGSLLISAQEHRITWQFVMVALRSRPEPSSLFELSRLLRELKDVDSLQISHARN